ncbi:MAG: hypothetical protein ABSH00_13875 [Bryobacteraceae bacterium]|jgi:hypothetical protein
MKRVLTSLLVSAILSLAALGAVVDGQWSAEGSAKTAPKKLSIHVNQNSLSGTMDGMAITRSGVDGGFFWFYVVRNGADFLYKGQIKGGKIELRESGPHVHRTLTFTRVQ